MQTTNYNANPTYGVKTNVMEDAGKDQPHGHDFKTKVSGVIVWERTA